mmetsp:Transcript_30731/g.46580  ORF Transcript_30731/g.46580 Transcript_30731/m.46580 type:complete len:213 (+) Transcript_30731:272-910(+)
MNLMFSTWKEKQKSKFFLTMKAVAKQLVLNKVPIVPWHNTLCPTSIGIPAKSLLRGSISVAKWNYVLSTTMTRNAPSITIGSISREVSKDNKTLSMENEKLNAFGLSWGTNLWYMMPTTIFSKNSMYVFIPQKPLEHPLRLISDGKIINLTEKFMAPCATNGNVTNELQGHFHHLDLKKEGFRQMFLLVWGPFITTIGIMSCEKNGVAEASL